MRPNAWLAAWLTPPSTVPDSERRQYGTHVLVSVVTFAVHVLLAALFAAMGEPWLALVYVGSCGVNAAAFVAARRGRWQLGVDMNVVELLVNVTAMSYLLGLASGYYLYYAEFPLYALVVRRDDWARRVGYSLAGYVIGAVVLMTAHAPVVLLPGWGVRALFLLNVGGSCSAILCAGLAGSLVADRSERLLAHERERSDRLLLNILPEEIAARLKNEAKIIADAFDSATVLFADIVGFTTLAAGMPSTALVAMLNDIFSTFDDLTSKHGLEKIKTIGDAYMVVGGVPRRHGDHAAAIARLALDMIVAIREYSERSGYPLSVRIGIHTGPVVAGVIGVRKFAYDLWGDTVNMASRMESHGSPGRIQITPTTADLLTGRFALTARGTIEVKGIGAMETFFLDGAQAT